MRLYSLKHILWPNKWRYDLIRDLIRGHRMRVDCNKRILWSTSKMNLSVENKSVGKGKGM